MSPILIDSYGVAAGGGGGGPGTLPVSGALLWLAPGFGMFTDAGTTPVSSDGDHIYQWNDQSGNGYNAVQPIDSGGGTGTPARPRYSTSQMNRSKATVWFSKQFAGVGDTTSSFNLPDALGTALSSAGQAEMFVVLKKQAANNDSSHGSWHLGTAGSSFLCWGDGLIYEGFGTNSRKDGITPGVDLSSTFRVYDVWSKTSDYGILIDNSSVYSTGSNTVSFNTSNVKFGYDDSGFGGMSAYVSEIVIFPFKLGSTDRSSMYTYLTT